MCEVLGLNPHQVHSLTIEYTPGELAIAKAVLYIKTDQEGEVIELVKRFREVPEVECEPS